MPKSFQNNFTNGIITPQLYRRLDYSKYPNSVKDALNFQIGLHGGMQYRRGTEFIAEAKPFYINPQWKSYDLTSYGLHSAVAWSELLKRLVILSEHSDGTRDCLYTDDFLTWNTTRITKGMWEKVIWCDDKACFVAVASTLTDQAIPTTYRGLISKDGITWVSTNMVENNEWMSVTYSPKLKMFVAVAQSGNNRVAYSYDGITWNLVNVPLQYWYRVIWVNFLEKFVAVSQDGVNQIMTSANGITWTLSSTGYPTRPWEDIAVNESGQYILMVSGGKEAANVLLKGVNSGDNISWSSLGVLPQLNKWTALSYSPIESTWICVSDDGINRIAESKNDGVTWTMRTDADNAITNWKRAIYISSLQSFVVTGLQLATNCYAIRFDYGLAEYRKIKLIPFVFSQEDAICLEFGDYYIRFIKDGKLVTTVSGYISGINKANPAVVSYVAKSQIPNDTRIIITNLDGMNELEHREFIVKNSQYSNGSGTFELLKVNSLNYSDYVSGGVINTIYEISTPYPESILDTLKYAQSGDILYLTHRDYETRKLSRLNDTSWTLNKLTLTTFPSSESDTILKEYRNVDSITHVGTTATVTINAGHNYKNKMWLTIEGANELEYNGTFQISNITATTFQYTMDSEPANNATGNITVSASTFKVKNKSGSNILGISGEDMFFEGDVGRNIKYLTSSASIVELLPPSDDTIIKTITTLTHSGKTATATTQTPHGYSTGDNLVVHGAKQTEYNGEFKITVTSSTTFTYQMGKNPGEDATGTDIVCYKSAKSLDISSLVQSNGVATATTATPHGFSNFDRVKIKGANQSEYNGTFNIYDVTNNTFSYDITGNPQSPATGNISCDLKAPTNVVAVNIIDEFPNTSTIPAGLWSLDRSPQSNITFNKRGQPNVIVKITANVPTFREGDIGKYIRIPRADTGEYATFEIKKLISNKEITAKVLKRLHQSTELTVNGGDWALESNDWTLSKGYPESVVFFQDRLCFSRDQTIWMSVTGDYENFNLGDTDDSAIKVSLLSRDINDIVWMENDRSSLVLGTLGGEFIINSGNNDITVTPSSIVIFRASNYGSIRNVDTIKTPNGIVFVQSSGTNIRIYGYDLNTDGYLAEDLTKQVHNLFQFPIRRIAFQSEPIPTIWVVSGQGELYNCAFIPKENIIGYTRFSFSYGFVENIAVLPTGKYPHIYIDILRDIGGVLKRYIERIELPYGYDKPGILTDKKDVFMDSSGTNTYKYGWYYTYEPITTFSDTKGKTAYFVDCGRQYVYDAPVTTIYGLNHLEGLEVTGLADGNIIPPTVVTNGKITLQTGAKVINVGLPYHGILELLPTFNTDVIRIVSISLNLYSSSNFKYGDSLSNLFESKFITYDSTNYTLWTGDAIETGFTGKYRRIPTIFIKQEKPLPLNILSITTHVD